MISHRPHSQSSPESAALQTRDRRTTSSSGDGRHSCPDCEKEAITVAWDPANDPPGDRGPRRHWRHTLKHTPSEVTAAAERGCPFFQWLKDHLVRSRTPPEQLSRTEIILDFQVGETADVGDIIPHWEFRAENTSAVTVIFSTINYSWSLPRFTVFSRFDDRSAEKALARCIVGNVSAPVSLLQIRHRLAFCMQFHSLCRRIKSSGARPTRFLDIESHDEIKLRTLHPESSQPYVTLSYVWGQDQSSKTTLNTLAKHESGISITTLPKTIRDAITVIRDVGVSLLWIDSLCIVQDDPEELAIEIANMAAYYGNSLFTLSVASAANCEQGFLGNHNPPRPTSLSGLFSFPILYPDIPTSSSLESERDATSNNNVTRGLLEFGLREAATPEPIDSRAWTLQEALLSTRLVSFGSSTITWSCPSAEYGLMQISHLRGTFQRRPGLDEPAEDLFRPGRRMYERIRNEDPYTSHRTMKTLLTPQPGGRSPVELRSLLSRWDDIVYEYSNRNLSSAGDRLLAISGVAREFAQRFRPPEAPGMGRYLAGMWWSDLLPLQLLWRREERAYNSPPPSSPVYTAPSWSWAAGGGTIDSKLQHDLMEYHADSFFYPASESSTAEPARILNCEVQLANRRAPYGALVGGSLTVRGKVQHVMPDTLDSHRVVVRFDNEDDPESGLLRETDLVGLTLLYLVRGKARPKSFLNPRTPAGLALMKNADGAYRRVGVILESAELLIFVTRWQFETIKIV